MRVPSVQFVLFLLAREPRASKIQASELASRECRDTLFDSVLKSLEKEDYSDRDTNFGPFCVDPNA